MSFIRNLFNLIKSMFSATVDFVVSPVLEIAGARPMIHPALSIGGLLARIAYVASFFVAVPSIIMAFAMAWMYVAFAALACQYLMFLGLSMGFAVLEGLLNASPNKQEMQTV